MKLPWDFMVDCGWQCRCMHRWSSIRAKKSEKKTKFLTFISLDWRATAQILQLFPPVSHSCGHWKIVINALLLIFQLLSGSGTFTFPTFPSRPSHHSRVMKIKIYELEKKAHSESGRVDLFNVWRRGNVKVSPPAVSSCSAQLWFVVADNFHFLSVTLREPVNSTRWWLSAGH